LGEVIKQQTSEGHNHKEIEGHPNREFRTRESGLLSVGNLELRALFAEPYLLLAVAVS